MSFILDALRKSENERQRSAVPGISHVPFAVTRYHLPGWALAIIMILGISVLALGGAWWNSSKTERDASTLALTAAPTVNVPIQIPEPSSIEQRRAFPGARFPNSLANRPLANLTDGLEGGAGPESLESIRDDDGAVEQPASTNAWQALPSASELTAQGIAVPELRLELHVFYPDRPADRFVIINGSTYHQGEVTTEGPKVVTIESTGAVLNHRGREFLLSPE